MSQDNKKKEEDFMQKNSLIYERYDITFAEIPKEVSLSFSIMGCQNRCVGCHSPQLRGLDGRVFNDDFEGILKAYKTSITTILLLGEGHDKKILIETLERLSKTGLKVALYSGRDNVDSDLVKYLDYYKVGSYQAEYGGLDCKTTNQKLYKIENGSLKDITSFLTVNF